MAVRGSAAPRDGVKIFLLLLPLLAAAQQLGTIEGIAFNRATKGPVAGVTVRFIAADDPGKRFEAVTDAGGAYRIENIPPGVYKPSVDAPRGFSPPDVFDLISKRIQVSTGVARFDAAMIPGGGIRGRVLDAEGRPVARARLEAVRPHGFRVVALSDAEGRFFMTPVAPGVYRLRALPPGAVAPTYYPNVTDPAAAETITVREGAELAAFDIRLRAIPARKLRGIVRDPDGKPATGVELSIAPPGDWNPLAATVTSDADGVFEFTPVPPGEWRISATARRDDVRWTGSAAVTMPDRDFDKVEVRIDPPFAVDVELEGAPRDRRMALQFELRPAASPFSLTVYEQNGRARFDKIYPGAYRVGAHGFVPGHYLKSILLGPADVTGRQIELGPASPPLRIVYAPNGGRINGEVEAGNDARVVLISADRENYVPGSDSLTITCDAQGRFNANDLRPGDWFAFAFASLDRMTPAEAIRERVFDGGLWRNAERVHVGEGETATVKLTVTNF